MQPLVTLLERLDAHLDVGAIVGVRLLDQVLPQQQRRGLVVVHVLLARGHVEVERRAVRQRVRVLELAQRDLVLALIVRIHAGREVRLGLLDVLAGGARVRCRNQHQETHYHCAHLVLRGSACVRAEIRVAASYRFSLLRVQLAEPSGGRLRLVDPTTVGNGVD